MKTHSALKRLDNKGSGIITVLVGGALIVILASILLFTAYSGYRIKLSERQGTETFYTAETALSEIRAGVQQAVTEAISDAYAQVLVEYNTSKDTEGDFRLRFLDSLLSWEFEVEERGTLPLFSGFNGIYTYDPQVLWAFVSRTEGISLSCHSDTPVSFTYEPGAALGAPPVSVTIHGIEVTCVNKGYESSVSSDLTILLPDFNYTLTEYSLTGVPEFAMIADTALTQNAGGDTTLELVGNAYAGSIDLSNNGNTLTVSGGTLISRGSVAISGTGYAREPRLILEGSASLWCGGISVGNNSSIKLLGTTYVADDLDIAGNNSKVELAGRYFGFGYLDNREISQANSAAGSSSIVVNGKNAALDMADLDTLMLAGNSFVTTGAMGYGGGDVLTGQSMTAKADQLAYLLPAECISTGQNPMVFTGNLSYSVDFDRVLWGSGAGAVKLGKYVADYGHVQVITSNLPSAAGYRVAYFFMRFDTKEAANAYFLDYFRHNPESVDAYAGLYLNALSAAASVQSSGYTYHVDDRGTADTGDDLLSLLGVSDSADASGMSVSASRLSNMFGNLCITLSSNVPASATTATSPFGYVVNSAQIDELLPDAETLFLDDSGDAAAMIVKNFGGAAFATSSVPDTVKILVATGNVLVNEDFDGLIIARGTVTMNRSVYANAKLVTGALRSSCFIGEEEYSLLHFMNVGASTGGSDEPGGETTWDTHTLVLYSNWKKY